MYYSTRDLGMRVQGVWTAPGSTCLRRGNAAALASGRRPWSDVM